MSAFARAPSGRERWRAGMSVPRHRHAQPYAALVLSGGYEECGSLGRFRVGPGDVLLHGAFDGHLDRFGCRGTEILNLALPATPAITFGLAHAGDADEIARIARKDVHEASVRLCGCMTMRAAAPSDWPDRLAMDLIEDPNCRLDSWSAAHGLAAETISRGFGRVFGLSPAAFRAEARARQAFTQILDGCLPLAAIAAGTGFADQAHMSRAIKRLTGSSPNAWRGSNRFKTASPIAA